MQIYSETCDFNPQNWYVDGIFGIGLNRDVKGIYNDTIDKLHDCPQVISIDIPSGIYCNTGLKAGNSVQADFTLTMGYSKLGHYFNDGLESSGIIHVLDIGFKALSQPHKYIQKIEHNDILYLCPEYSDNNAPA